MHILEKIIANKRKEVKDRIRTYPIRVLERSNCFQNETISMTEILQSKEQSGIIAEFKRRSPSKGLINGNSTVHDISIGYVLSGASGLSILTDEKFFGGKSEDLLIARELTTCPILRKDFIVDPYQIFEAKSLGADIILLIAAALSKREVKEFSGVAKGLGLEVLLEIHNENELDSLCYNVDILGVNNRNLKTFETSTSISKELASKIPSDIVKISESGLDSPFVISELMDYGFQGFLIGERFMREPDPISACNEFITSLKIAES